MEGNIDDVKNPQPDHTVPAVEPMPV
jgi:hypothetical protein